MYALFPLLIRDVHEIKKGVFITALPLFEQKSRLCTQVGLSRIAL